MSEERIVRIKMARGSASIEIEASRPDAEHFLQQYWTPPRQEAEAPEDNAQPEEAAGNREAPRRKSTRGRKGSAASPPSRDMTALAKALKESKDFQKLWENVLKPRPAFPKIAAILHSSSDPLSAAEIGEALRQLGVKMEATNINKALKKNTRSIIEDSTRGDTRAQTYTLTATAKDEFVLKRDQ